MKNVLALVGMSLLAAPVMALAGPPETAFGLAVAMTPMPGSDPDPAFSAENIREAVARELANDGVLVEASDRRRVELHMTDLSVRDLENLTMLSGVIQLRKKVWLGHRASWVSVCGHSVVTWYAGGEDRTQQNVSDLAEAIDRFVKGCIAHKGDYYSG
jgi:hypothetical protein